jgi:hypothetical protein
LWIDHRRPRHQHLTTDTQNDTLLKWQVDSWEIVFAPNPGTTDGANYIKFAGDSAGFWDDISPDSEGGTDWSAPSFETNAYIIDGNTWAAEFSVDIADIESMFTGYDSYGHIGIQVKDPALNFAFPDRGAFSSRNAHWDLSALDPTPQYQTGQYSRFIKQPVGWVTLYRPTLRLNTITVRSLGGGVSMPFSHVGCASAHRLLVK